jgi:hypothetical protein
MTMKKKQMILVLMLLSNSRYLWSQSVGIGTTNPNTSSVLDLSGSSKPLLLPRLTTILRNGLNPGTQGFVFYNTSTNLPQLSDGTAWLSLLGIPDFSTSVGGQTLAYNSGKWAASNFLWNPGSQVNINSPNAFTTYRLNVEGGGNNYDGISGRGFSTGVYGESTNPNAGVGSTGVTGHSLMGDGVLGTGNDNGVFGIGNSSGIRGQSTSGNGVFGESTSGEGVHGVSSSNYGVYGSTTSGSAAIQAVNFGGGNGVQADALGSGYGIYATSVNGTAVSGTTQTGFAGYFKGPKTYIEKLGVGTSSPLAPLHVAGSDVIGSTSAQYIMYGYNGAMGLYYNGANPTWATGLLVDNDIVTRRSLVSAQNVTNSDARIKNIVGQSNQNEDLQTLRKIVVTNYTFKDVVKMGYGIQKKVIAQQVEQVYPQAVQKRSDFIPDIYAVADVVTGTNELILTLQKPHGLTKSTKIKLIDNNQTEFEAMVTGVSSANQFSIDVSEPVNTSKLFVYGRKVDDFRAVDYEALAVLNISSTQALLVRLEQAEKKIAMLEKKLQTKKSGKVSTPVPLPHLKKYYKN